MNFDEFNNVVPRFFDRTQAGRRLAKALWRYREKPDTIVAGIPRGGVITAAAVAESLELPVDVVPVGKVQVPGHDGRPPFARRTVIIVDDGIGPGSTMDAAIQVVRRAGAERIVAAVPVGAPDCCQRLRSGVDDFVCLETPEPFFGIAYWYTHFPSADEREVTQPVTQTRWSPLALA